MEQFEILALETLESKTQVVQSITEHASQFTSNLSEFQTHAQNQIDGLPVIYPSFKPMLRNKWMVLPVIYLSFKPMLKIK